MPYISSETVAQKRKQIKAALKGFKVSVTRSSHSGINVDILSGPMDMGYSYLQVNQYYIKEHYAEKPDVMNLLQSAYEMAAEGKTTGHYDSDYGFIPSFYVNICIGAWNKPYQCTK
jgi:hypothetical protein